MAIPQSGIPGIPYLRECFVLDSNRSLIWRERPVGHFESERDCQAWNATNAGKQAGGPDGRVQIDGQRVDLRRVAIALAMPRGYRATPVEVYGAKAADVLAEELVAAEAFMSDTRAIWRPDPEYLEAYRRMATNGRVIEAAAWIIERKKQWTVPPEEMIAALMNWAAVCVAEKRVPASPGELKRACKEKLKQAVAFEAEAEAARLAGDMTRAIDALHNAVVDKHWAKRRAAMAEGRGSPGDLPVVEYSGRKKDRGNTVGKATRITLTKVMRAFCGNSMRTVCFAFAAAAADDDLLTRDMARRRAIKP
jgi:hypothetical protein